MTSLPCPRNCGRQARQHPLFGVLPCLECVSEDQTKRKATRAPEFYAQTMQTRVQEQRDRHEKDIMPPYDHNGLPNEEFARAYPEKAKELFGEYERVTGTKTKF
jgi:hypothetical protein